VRDGEEAEAGPAAREGDTGALSTEPVGGVGPSRHYYPALDGMRALAAVLVFLFHYLQLPYGWAGVDLFFVLSGFLITGILYDGREGEHRFRNFYMRRVFRIFPLYYGVLAALFVAAAVFHLGYRMGVLVWPFYVGNYLPWFSTDPYQFEVIGPLVIVHLWSLCIEEQFYLLWPAVVFRVGDRVRLLRICVALILGLPLVRLILCLLLPPATVLAGAIYTSTPTRMDSLLMGGALALWMRGPERGRVMRSGYWALGTALVVLATAHVLLGYAHASTARWVEWMQSVGYSMTALAGAGVLILCLDERSPVARGLSRGAIRSFGQRTYGFYVYHVIPIAFFTAWVARLKAKGEPWAMRNPPLAALFFVGITGVSYASYRWFESPFLRLKRRFEPEGRRG
jgi:peptidoglycan/LPS O-acetylase OafA/YrhL